MWWTKLLIVTLLMNFIKINCNKQSDGQQQDRLSFRFDDGDDENCETLPSEIHLIKEEYDELGRLQRTCNGDVQVNKCEGQCNSQVQPSVITATGFLKECYCCREGYLRERIVNLTYCYDPDGIRITDANTKSNELHHHHHPSSPLNKRGYFGIKQRISRRSGGDDDDGNNNHIDQQVVTLATMELRLKEPADCRCFKCSDLT